MAEYQAPSRELYDKTADCSFGFSSQTLYSDCGMYVISSPESGLYVFKVEEGSVAHRAGLQPEDVVYGIDELLWRDEPNITVYAKSRLLDGQPVTFRLYRKGEPLDIMIRPEDTGRHPLLSLRSMFHWTNKSKRCYHTG